MRELCRLVYIKSLFLQYITAAPTAAILSSTLCRRRRSVDHLCTCLCIELLKPAFIKVTTMSTSAVVIAGVVVNILSVVGIVITNKYITEVDGFHFMVFLSFLHFAFTTIGTRVLLMMNVFTYQPAPLSGILPVAAGSLLSVAFMNLNLSYNSVGFYQVT